MNLFYFSYLSIDIEGVCLRPGYTIVLLDPNVCSLESSG